VSGPAPEAPVAAAISPPVVTAGPPGPAAKRGRRAALDGPHIVAAAVVVLGLVLAVVSGPREFAQVTVNGLVTGAYYALAAVGLTVITSMLRVINFAHSELLTVGAFVALWAHVSLGLPMVLAGLLAVVAGALLGLGIEVILWRPMRRRRSSVLPLMLMTIGLAFVLREGVHFFAGSTPRPIGVDVISVVEVAGVRVGRTQLLVLVVGASAILLLGFVLSSTTVGKRVRAVSDNLELAETAGIDTTRVILLAWLVAGGLAGLAGVLYASALGTIGPGLGSSLLLGIFAAMALGGVGNTYGALAGGMLIGLAQEWSTLIFEARWKIAVGFVILILTLILRPEGVLARGARAAG
jgi:neutral amino acid transport system permease protein